MPESFLTISVALGLHVRVIELSLLPAKLWRLCAQDAVALRSSRMLPRCCLTLAVQAVQADEPVPYGSRHRAHNGYVLSWGCAAHVTWMRAWQCGHPPPLFIPFRLGQALLTASPEFSTKLFLWDGWDGRSGGWICCLLALDNGCSPPPPPPHF